MCWGHKHSFVQTRNFSFQTCVSSGGGGSLSRLSLDSVQMTLFPFQSSLAHYNFQNCSSCIQIEGSILIK